MMKRFIVPILLFSGIFAACGPATFTMDVEMRGPSKSGISLCGKGVSVLYLEQGGQSDSLLLASISEGFAQAVEKDCFGGEEAVEIYSFRKDGAPDYTSKEALVNLVVETGSDVVFLFEKEDEKELRLSVYDALNPKDSVYRYFYPCGNISNLIDSVSEKELRSLGGTLAGKFLSVWTEGSYSVVYFEYGEQAWQTGAEAAADYRWKDAIDAWMTILGTKNLQKRGCAEYNIALACYMLGQKTLAIEWLDKADTDYFIYPSVVLRKHLVP